MPFVIVAVALLLLTVKGYSGKKTSCYAQGTSDAFLFNLIRMLLCSLIGIILVFAEDSQYFLELEPRMLIICALAGIANAVFVATWFLSIQHNSLVSVDVSLTLGSIIPAVLCATLFGEAISLPKMIGFVLILFATLILSTHSKQSAKTNVTAMLLLILPAIGDGMVGFAQQLYRIYYTETGSLTHGVYYPKTIYHFYTYIFAALILLVILIAYQTLFSKKANTHESTHRSVSVPPYVIMHIVIMAACLFASNYLQTIATNDYGMSSQVLYPITKGGCLITANIVGMLFFGEKMTIRSFFGTLVALVGIISMSIL